jgi:hypothetical protein
MCKKLIYLFTTFLVLSWTIGTASAGIAYSDPSGGWTYIYTGDAAANPDAAALDGTWDHNNGSDVWDGSIIGAGTAGGVSALSESGVNFLRIQDALTSGSGNDSRKICFGHSITNDIGATIAGPLLDDGVTISFRARLSTTSPLDGTWPAGGDGYVPHDGGKDTFSIRQSTSDKIISFCLVPGTDGQLSSGAAMLGGRSGLCMNSRNGTSPTGDVDIYQGEGTLNLLDIANLTVWHEFWIIIQVDTSGSWTHKVSVYMDGSVTPTVFYVTAGTGNDYDVSYMGLGHGSTAQMGAIDVDFFGYKQGVILPSPSVGTKASNSSPADKATDVPRDAVLRWKPGMYANTHDVYFGTDSTAVQNANSSDVSGIYRGRKPKDPNSYDPPEILNFSKIYYWRVDEVNGPPDYTIYTGSVWSFTAEPFAYPITPIAATASSSNTTGMVPGKTIDGSGLTNDQHSTTDTTMWLSSTTPQPTWIQYEFDRVYKLYEMWVWNYNSTLEPSIGFGLKDVTIQYSTDGANWTQLSGVPQFARAPGLDTYVHNTTVNFQGVAAKYVKITANSNWGGLVQQYGLSEVRFFYIPTRAREPSPASGATGVGLDNVVLSWRAGRDAVSHKVYFSSNSGAVISGAALVGTVGTNSYNLGPLELGRTYYWKIDEVNLAATPTTWQGDLWRFTTRDNFVVEDFESYTNTSPNIIRETWIDGQGFPGHPGNGSGSKGYPDPNYAELVNIHGGKQALPVDYNNTKSPYYSEVNRTFAATQNWTAYGVNLLSLWLRGRSASVGSFVESPAGVYTMTASGEDIWDVPDVRRPSKGYHDEFRYAYMQVSSDYAITAKVESITNTDVWAKAGVMIRDSADANSMHVMSCLTPGSGIAFQHREVAGGLSYNDFNTPPINAPYWVGLKRQGNLFTALYCSDGILANFAPLGSISLTMPDPVCIGLSLTSHNTAATCTAVFSDVHLYIVNPDNSVTEVIPLPSWTSRDIGIKSNVAAPVYVTLQDSGARTATVTHDDPNIALATAYQEWLIPLARFTSLNPSIDLTKLQKVTVGVGNRGTGTLYFDDILLYGSRCLSGRPGLVADLTSDCFVDYSDLNIMTGEWLKTDSAIPTSAPGDANLVASYQFENNYLDSSGHNLNGDPGGSPTFQAGAVGSSAVGLNGSSYVNFNKPALLDFGTGNWSVCAWIKTTMSGTDDTQKGTIFAKGGDDTGGIRYALGVGEVTSGRVTLTTDDNVTKVQATASATIINDNVWHHVVGMRDGTTLRIYVDGLLGGTNTLSAGYNLAGTSQHNAYVGVITNYVNSSLYKSFNGLIDDVRVYSRALSPAEVAYLAAKGASELYIPLISPAELYSSEPPKSRKVDLRDYAILADTWLEDLFWPPPVTNVWAYEFKNDANCYDPGPPIEARDLHLEFDGAVYLVDTGPFTSFTGNGTSTITLSAGIVPANGRTIIRVGSTGGEKTLNKWYWTDATGQRISKEMAGVGPSCKKIN